MQQKYKIYPLKPTNLCLCESGSLFSECCGADLSAPPREILIFSNALSEKKCDYFVDYLRSRPKVWLPVNDPSYSLTESKYLMDERRRTEDVSLGKLKKQVYKFVGDFFSGVVKNKFDKQLIWYETPHVLYYKESGEYKAHADADVFNENTGYWERILDRDYSFLAYFSDNYEGGALTFNRFGYSYKPKKGDVIIFPSDGRYMHAAEPVVSGERFALVSWGAVKESKKVKLLPPDKRIDL